MHEVQQCLGQFNIVEWVYMNYAASNYAKIQADKTGEDGKTHYTVSDITHRDASRKFLMSLLKTKFSQLNSIQTQLLSNFTKNVALTNWANAGKRAKILDLD